MLLETLEYLGIAFICSVILIIMSKIILQALIRRPADYYNARELREEELMLNAGGISITKEHETNPEGEIIEEKHLEAQLGDIEAAEPEEIMLEVPDAIAESIEVHKEQEDEVAETVSEPEKETEEAAEPEKESVEFSEEPEPEPEPLQRLLRNQRNQLLKKLNRKWLRNRRLLKKHLASASRPRQAGLRNLREKKRKRLRKS